MWKSLGNLVKESEVFKNALKIQLIGQTDESIIKDIEENDLSENLLLIDHLPHQEGLVRLSQSQVLLLPLNDAPNVKGILPGKMYEYIALRRPVIAIGPLDGDFARIIQETNAGKTHSFDDISGISQTLKNYFDLFQSDKLKVESGSYEKYSRKNLAKRFVELSQESI